MTVSSFSWLGRLLTSGRGDMRLYHLLFFSLALMVAFSDEVIAWASSRTSKLFGGWVRAAWVLFLIALTAAATFYLMHLDPRFVWWEPLALTGFCVLLRLVRCVVGRLFYPHDG
jgi:hypothetical protein